MAKICPGTEEYQKIQVKFQLLTRVLGMGGYRCTRDTTDKPEKKKKPEKQELTKSHMKKYSISLVINKGRKKIRMRISSKQLIEKNG